MIMRKLLLVALIMLPMLALSQSQAFAYDPFGTVCSNGGSGSAVCKDANNSGGNPLTGSDGTITRVVNLLALITGAIAVVIIIISGLRMVLSGGSSDAVAGARRAVIYAAVGLVIIVLSRTIIIFIIGKV